MKNKKIKVGVLGVTHPHSGAHIRTLELLDEIHSIVLWDENNSSVEEFQIRSNSKFEIGKSSFDEIMNRDDIPIVISLAKNNQNPDWIRRAAEAGKHVLTEKPVAAKSQDMPALVNSIRHSGVHLGVYYTWRSHPIVKDLKEIIESVVIGKLLSVVGRMVTSQVRFRDPSHWLFQKQLSGGGILSWLACHWIDVIRYITGDEVKAVSSMVDTLNEQDIDVEDTAAVIMQLGNGAIASLHAGYLLPISQTGYMLGSYDTYLSFRGLEGNITWYPTEQERPVIIETTSKVWNSTPRRELRYVVSETDGYGGQYGQDFVSQFITSAMRGDPPVNDGENALRVLKIIEAAYESSKTGCRILLDK